MTLLLGALVVLSQYLDCMTTRIGMGMGASEANMIADYLITNYGQDGFLAIKLIAGVAFSIGLRRNPNALAMLAIAHVGVVAWNLHVILRLVTHS